MTIMEIGHIAKPIVITKEWNNLIFNDPNTSFGFVFCKPDIEDINDKLEIEKLWKVFIEESKLSETSPL